MSPDADGTAAGGFRAELDALHADARVWREASRQLGLRRNHAAGLIVPAAPLSRWAIDAGFPALYEQARARVEALLDQAGSHFDAIGTTLEGAAETFRHEDEQGAHRFEGR